MGLIYKLLTIRDSQNFTESLSEKSGGAEGYREIGKCKGPEA